MPEHPHRAPRIDLSFPLEFDVEGEVIAGHCLNISASGLLANFSGSVEVWTEGDLHLHFGDNSRHVSARVARVNGNEAGLAFSFKGDHDREAIGAMLAFTEGRTHIADGPPPF